MPHDASAHLRGTCQAPLPAEALPHKKPARFSFTKTREGFEVSYRWSSREHTFWTIFVLPLWMMFGLSMPGWIISQLQEKPDLLFSIRTWGAGLFALLSWLTFYSVLVSRFNHTRISLRLMQKPMPQRSPLQRSEGYFLGALSIWHGPLPWKKSVTLSTETLKDVYCRTLQEEDDEVPLYLLMATLQDGSRKVLLSFFEKEEAYFLEEKIRAAFRMKR